MAIVDARIKMDNNPWHVPRYTISTIQQGNLSEQILSKTPTELHYIEISVFMKEVSNQNESNLELVSQKT